MTSKGVFYALAVVVLMGTTAVVALADYDWAAGATKPDASVSSPPEQYMEPSATGEIREPMETGAVPDRSVDSSDLHSNPAGNESTVDFGGQLFRPDIDTGP